MSDDDFTYGEPEDGDSLANEALYLDSLAGPDLSDLPAYLRTALTRPKRIYECSAVSGDRYIQRRVDRAKKKAGSASSVAASVAAAAAAASASGSSSAAASSVVSSPPAPPRYWTSQDAFVARGGTPQQYSRLQHLTAKYAPAIAAAVTQKRPTLNERIFFIRVHDGSFKFNTESCTIRAYLDDNDCFIADAYAGHAQEYVCVVEEGETGTAAAAAGVNAKGNNHRLVVSIPRN